MLISLSRKELERILDWYEYATRFAAETTDGLVDMTTEDAAVYAHLRLAYREYQLRKEEK